MNSNSSSSGTIVRPDAKDGQATSVLNRLLRKPDSSENVITATMFLVACFLLAIFSIARFGIGDDAVSVAEQRHLSPRPEFSWDSDHLKKFPLSFEHFFDDRFAIRTKLIALSEYVKFFVFDMSPTDRVLKGLDGWFYFLAEGDKELLRNYPPLPEANVNAWTTAVTQRKQWMDKHHIRYVLVITPSKSSIYPEFIPSEDKPVPGPKLTDQLIAAIKARSDVEIVDLRPTLREAKKAGQVWFKTDTHWNRIGAFAGYQALAAKLTQWFPQLKPFSQADLVYNPSLWVGDMAKMVGFKDWLTEPFIDAHLKHQTWQNSKEFPPPDEKNMLDVFTPYATVCPDKNKPRAYVCFDSFLLGMMPFFAEHFSFAYFNRNQEMVFSRVAAQKPDVVIEEVNERFFRMIHLKNYD